MAAKIAQNSPNPYLPDYSFTIGWEDNFDVKKSVQFVNDYSHIPFILGLGVYLSVLYFGQIIMANKEPIKLKSLLVLWNSGLALFSLMGFLRVFPELVFTWNKFGFLHTVCNNSYLQSKPTAFWIYLFVLSKAPELVDTLFLVLRKQKLIFLHVYHHASVLIFAWFVYANSQAAARWFCAMNFGVHTVMYTYYALKAFPDLIRIPKWVSMVITCSQTIQMVMGAYAVASAKYAQMTGHKCDTSTGLTFLGLGIYGSYLVLFSHFFYKSYCSPTPLKVRNATDKKQA